MATVYPSAPEALERDMNMVVRLEEDGQEQDVHLKFLYRFEQLMTLRDHQVGAVFSMSYLVVKLGTDTEPLEHHRDLRYRITEVKGMRYEMESLQQGGLSNFTLPLLQAPRAPILIEAISRVASPNEGPRLLSNPVLVPSPLDIHSWAHFICNGQLHRLLAQFQTELGVVPLLGHQSAPPEGKMPAPRLEQDKRFLAVMLGRAVDSVRWICEERDAKLSAVKAYLDSNESYFFVQNLHCVIDQVIRILYAERFDRYWRLVEEGVPRTRAFQQAEHQRGSGKPDAGGKNGKKNE